MDTLTRWLLPKIRSPVLTGKTENWSRATTSEPIPLNHGIRLGWYPTQFGQFFAV